MLTLAATLGRAPTDAELSADWYRRIRERAPRGLRGLPHVSPLDWTQAEIDGFADAAAMEDLGSVKLLDLVVPVWLERINGITHAARIVYAIISDFRDITEPGIAARVGAPWTANGWSRYVDEVVAFGLVLRGTGGVLRAKKRPA
jgi:hypothetical protein